MKHSLLLALIVTLLCGVGTARAQDESPLSGMKVGAFVSTSYHYNFNQPDNEVSPYRVFDSRFNNFNLDVLEVSLYSPATKPGMGGFRADVIAGSAIPKVAASAGMFTGQDIDLKQLYVTYIIPVGSGLTMDFGKFVTSMGYELIDGRDGYNDNATRSFCFGWAIPFTHTGLSLGYAFSDQVSAKMMVVNGWDNVQDNNKSKSVMGVLSLVPVEKLKVIGSVIYGPERANNNSDNRMVFDGVATYAITDQFSIGANFDLGSDAKAVTDTATGNLADAQWTGFAGYLRYNVSDMFSIALRGEMFDDADGVRTGTVQKLSSITLTPELRPYPNLVLRADIRMDNSDFDGGIFPAKPENGLPKLEKSQTTVTFNMIFIVP